MSVTLGVTDSCRSPLEVDACIIFKKFTKEEQLTPEQILNRDNQGTIAVLGTNICTYVILDIIQSFPSYVWMLKFIIIQLLEFLLQTEATRRCKQYPIIFLYTTGLTILYEILG